MPFGRPAQARRLFNHCRRVQQQRREARWECSGHHIHREV